MDAIVSANLVPALRPAWILAAGRDTRQRFSNRAGYWAGCAGWIGAESHLCRERPYHYLVHVHIVRLFDRELTDADLEQSARSSRPDWGGLQRGQKGDGARVVDIAQSSNHRLSQIGQAARNPAEQDDALIVRHQL
jgi:hypothetical protein